MEHLDNLLGWWNRRRLRKAARLILKATQGARHCLTVQKVGREVADETSNLARWVFA
jgi:hypothetical protein